MTRAESILLMKSAQLMLVNPTTNEPVSDLYEALEMAISALEQNESAEKWYKLFVEKFESCEDVISREDALKCFEGFHQTETLAVGYIRSRIRQLPSVIPSRQVIEDIKNDIRQIVDEETEHDEKWARGLHYALCIIEKHWNCGDYEPSRRKGHWLYKRITDDYRVKGQCSECKQRKIIDNFCPNCGAKMESEDKG